MGINVNQLANAIAREVVAYDKKVAKAVQRETRRVANETAEELRQNSPRKTGRYASGWAVRKDGEGYRVYNKESPQLTHLLEFGHAKVNGGRVPPAKIHIRPAEEKAIENLEARLREVVSE